MHQDVTLLGTSKEKKEKNLQLPSQTRWSVVGGDLRESGGTNMITVAVDILKDYLALSTYESKGDKCFSVLYCRTVKLHTPYCTTVPQAPTHEPSLQPRLLKKNSTA